MHSWCTLRQGFSVPFRALFLDHQQRRLLHCPSLLDCSCTHPPPPHYDDAVQYAERARQVVKHARAEMLTDRFVTALAGGEGRSLLLSLVGRELAARRKRHDDINLLLDAANSNA